MRNPIMHFLSCAVLLTSALAHAQKAALVQNVDEKGRVPFQQFFSRGCASNANSCIHTIGVPAGQRLVVTHINGALYISAKPNGVYALLNEGTHLPSGLNESAFAAGNQGIVIPVVDVGQTTYASHGYAFDKDITFYVDGGAGAYFTLGFMVLPVVSDPNAAVDVTIAGYLIPLPSGSATN